MALDKDRVATIKEHIAAGRHKDAFAALNESITPWCAFPEQARAARLFASIATTDLGLRPIRIALLASSTVDQLVDALKFWLAAEGFEAKFWVAPYATIALSILSDQSALYEFDPQIVWLFETFRDIRIDIAPGDVAGARKVIGAAVSFRQSLWSRLQQNLKCTIIQNNADVPAGDGMGNFAAQALWSQRSILRQYNLDLAHAAPSGVVIFDFDHLSSLNGKRTWFDPRYWYHSKSAVGFSEIGQLAFQAARVIGALKGTAKKCLVLDLDNTLWGGVIGDEGIDGIELGAGAAGEAFVDFQRWLKALQQRGIILAVCSKNDAVNAKEPFQKHPDMQLNLDDIAVFSANWNNKAENIREISKILNLGLESLVFVDDNPAERDLVKKLVPEVAVPELPEDPAEYRMAIEKHLYFETTGFSDEDRDRTHLYQGNASRAGLQAQFKSEAEYLKSLGMIGHVGGLDSFNLPRMTQLVNKSNQFNLTTKRYSEGDLKSFDEKQDMRVLHFSLLDRFGANGLISVVVAAIRPDKTLFIDLWVMSCRVLARTMEEFICNKLIDTAKEAGCNALVGEYIPTAKNGIVARLYDRLGFELVDEENRRTTWRLSIEAAPAYLTTFVAQQEGDDAPGRGADAHTV